jgi:hypothetical protein
VRIQNGTDYGATTRKRSDKMAHTKGSLDIENDFVAKFNAAPAFREIINESLGGTDYVSAEKSSHEFMTSEWQGLAEKHGKIEVPKSDYYFESSAGERAGISFKNGPGRATSSNYLETLAIFKTVLQHNLGKYANEAQLGKDVHAFFALWEPCMINIRTSEIDSDMTIGYAKSIRFNEAQRSKRKNMDKILTYIDCSTELNVLVKQLREDHREYMLDVIAEALTGEYKFGEDNLAYAKHYIRCKKGQLDNITVATATTNLSSAPFRAECEKTLDSGALNIAMKTAGTGKSIWIRFM